MNYDESEEKKLAIYIYILPNLLTTGNLFCGFFAIIEAIKGNILNASYAIVFAAIFDLLDGRMARLTRSTSRFGAEYDSLCDLISFGMAPAIILWQWSLNPFGRLGWVISFLYIACTALRLARFNVQAHVVEKNYFQGLPSPMSAGIVASSVIAFTDLGWDSRGNIWLLMMTALLAFVMVSNFRYRSFKDLDLKQRLPFRFLLLGLCVIVVVALYPEVMLFMLFLSYAILGAVFGILKLGKNIKKLKPNVYTPANVNDPDLIEEEDEIHEKT